MSRAYRARVFGKQLQEADRRANAIQEAIDPTDIYLEKPEAKRLQKIACKLWSCCDGAAIQHSPSTGKLRLCEYRCKSRLCPRCNSIRTRQLAVKVENITRLMQAPKFLTLTVRSSDAPLRQQIQHLTECFKKLRRRKDWKAHVQGGIFTIEATYNAKRGQWHPHLHIVMDADYWNQKSILAAWEASVGDTAGAHIKAVNDSRAIARYVSNYVAKSSDLTNIRTHGLMREWADAVHGLRFAQTFGAYHNIKAHPDEDEPDKAQDDPITDWIHAHDADEVAEAANSGDAQAAQLLKDLQRDQEKATYDRLTEWQKSLRSSIMPEGGYVRPKNIQLQLHQ